MVEMKWKDLWPEEELKKLENGFIDKFTRCDSPEAVEAAITFCKYLCHKGLDGDNYPLFLEMLKNDNHHLIDALLGEKDPFTFFLEAQIQPNSYSVKTCFDLLKEHSPGELYEKTLMVILGIIENTYNLFSHGYRIYPLDTTDVNSLGKNLDENKDQEYPVNKIILDILYDIGESQNPEGDENREEVLSQATKVRNCFLDGRKSLREAIPEKLLELHNGKAHVDPREIIPIHQLVDIYDTSQTS